MKPSKEEKKDIKKTLTKADPIVDIKRELEITKAACKNMNEDTSKRINEIDLSMDHIMNRIKKLESRLGIYSEGS